MTSTGQHDSRRMTRRGFFGLARRLGANAAQGLLSAPTAPAPGRSAPAEIDVGTLDELRALAPGTVSTQFAGSGQFYLVRVAEGMLALDRRCPGEACAVLWQQRLAALPADQALGWAEGRFVCLTHGMQFDRYGQPNPALEHAPGPLLRLALLKRDGRVVVALSAPPSGAPERLLFPLPVRS